MNPRLSFVIPVYRPKLDLLAKAVKALCEQSLKSWDVTFVLDGPDSGAKSVIRSGMKKKVNHYRIIEQEHGGAPKARNTGAQHAKGDFVCFFDCDSIIEPDAAQMWVNVFDKNPDVAFVYSGYQFLNEGGAINSEPFDPYTLRIRNYVSACFPVRREFMGTWNESLKSLQDWDFWLQVLEKGGRGKFLEGYAFWTATPEPGSISGDGCRDDVWLERVDAVKKIHNLPERDICVSALGRKHDGVWLAKVLGADYQDIPNFKPHRYKTIIQYGFNFLPGFVETHCEIFGEKGVNKVVFFTCDDIYQIINRLNLNAIWKYSTLLNSTAKLYVEDKGGYDLLRKAGFNVEVRPLPLAVETPPPLPEKVCVGVDIDPNYGPVFEILQKSLPDIELLNLSGAHKIADLSALAHFHPDRTVSVQMKRAVLAGRPVISNVQAPFMGFVDDAQDLDRFLPAAVEKIRASVGTENNSGREFYAKQSTAEKFLEAING